MHPACTPLLLRLSPALLALAAAVPLAAQQSPGGFSLPEPTPTPTPAPAGPADEVAGVPIPPRAVPQPRIAPAPVLEAGPSPAPRPAPAASPSLSPSPSRSAPRAAPGLAPGAAPTPSAPVPAAPEAAAPAPAPAPVTGFETFTPPAAPAPSSPAPSSAPSEALGAAVIDWRWLAGGAGALALLLGGGLLWRRRKPRVLRLAAPVTARPEEDAEPVLPRIAVSVEIPGASRSVMTFTLRYRINLANRAERAVNDLAVAVQLTTARQGQNNAAPIAAAQSVTRVERIGPHQSRSVSGEVQLPFAGIAPVMQGRTMLFIPLLHVTIEGEGQQALAKSFVIGTPGASDGRVQPLRMDMLPGSAPELRARAIDAPPPA
jgi:hypothetical protein